MKMKGISEELEKAILQFSNTGKLGEKIEMSFSSFEDTLDKSIGNLSYDSIISINRIDNGYIYFSTYAMYFRQGNILNSKYICVPYLSIKDLRISNANTNKQELHISYLTENNIKEEAILEEKKMDELALNSLIMTLQKIEVSEFVYDRYISLEELGKSIWERIIELMIYMLNNEGKGLYYAYVLAYERNLENEWELLNSFDTKKYNFFVDEILNSVPLMSVRYTSNSLVKLLIQMINYMNQKGGIKRGSISHQSNEIIKYINRDFMDNDSLSMLLLYQTGDDFTYERLYKAYQSLNSNMIDYVSVEKEINNELKEKETDFLHRKNYKPRSIILPDKYLRIIEDEEENYRYFDDNIILNIKVKNNKNKYERSLYRLIEDFRRKGDSCRGLIEVDKYDNWSYILEKVSGSNGQLDYEAVLYIKSSKKEKEIVIRASGRAEKDTRDIDVYTKLKQIMPSTKVIFENWKRDPYDYEYSKGILMNYSEMEAFDEDYPNHPLSRIRIVLKDIISLNLLKQL